MENMNKNLNTAAFMIHSAIHEARPDVICAAHTHSKFGKAFAALGIELDMLTQVCQTNSSQLFPNP